MEPRRATVLPPHAQSRPNGLWHFSCIGSKPLGRAIRQPRMDLNSITEIARPRVRAELVDWRSGDAWLAGGTWLFSEPQPQLRRLIDLSALGWPAWRASPHGLQIAATCTVAELDALTLPPEWIASPLINQCCRSFLASFKIWNAATVGGNICMSLPAGPMIALTAALEGVCTIWSPGGNDRQTSVPDLVVGAQRNTLAPGELLRMVELPASALSKRTAFRQISLTPLGRSAALLIGTLDPRAKRFSLTVTAATVAPIRIEFSRMPSRATLAERMLFELPDAAYFSDPHGTPAWRRDMTLEFAEQIRRELSGETYA
jgi:CO/xanthine dehydrogenase FAD-binding subunit